MEYSPEVWQGKIQHLDIDNFHISVEELYDGLKLDLTSTVRQALEDFLKIKAIR